MAPPPGSSPRSNKPSSSRHGRGSGGHHQSRPPREPSDDEAIALMSSKARTDEWDQVLDGSGRSGGSGLSGGQGGGGSRHQQQEDDDDDHEPLLIAPAPRQRTSHGLINQKDEERKARSLEKERLRAKQQQQQGGSRRPPSSKQSKRQDRHPKEEQNNGGGIVGDLGKFMGRQKHKDQHTMPPIVAQVDTTSSIACSTLTTPSALLHGMSSTISTVSQEDVSPQHEPLLPNNNNNGRNHSNGRNSSRSRNNNDRNGNGKKEKHVGFSSGFNKPEGGRDKGNSNGNGSSRYQRGSNMNGSQHSTTSSAARSNDQESSYSNNQDSALSMRKNGKRKPPWFSSNKSKASSNSSWERSNYNANATGVQYRSATSTQRALEELKKKRLEMQEKRRAMSVLGVLFVVAAVIHFAGQGRGGVWNLFFGTSASLDGDGGANGVRGSRDKVYGDTKDLGYGGERPGGLVAGAGQAGAAGSGGALEDENFEYQLPPPVEKTYDAEHEFLLPLKHFSSVPDPQRPSDTAFFFHVPRAGGSTMKDIIGKCLKLVQSSEVGVRDGHGADPKLQVMEVQGGSKYVNVDTTTIPGIQRAVDLGLSGSGMADVIVSSYFHESSALFDLMHQGRPFILLRDPIERATSMYWHRVKEVGDLDATTTIEDYAQGNGIENNWMCRFLANRMTGELTKDDLDIAKEILKDKFLVGFVDDLEESIYRIMKFNGWKFSVDETEKMKEEDCIKELTSVEGGSNVNPNEYELPKRGSQAHALITWQTQFDGKLFVYAKELFDHQTKEWGSKERKKALKKEKKKKNG